MKRGLKYLLVVFFIILADQGSKLWVYHHMELNSPQSIHLIGNLLKITYVLNYGMAFSIQLGFKYGKLLITLVRMIVSVYIVFYIAKLWKRKVAKPWIWGWVLVLGGAIGNSIDSIFYGVYLNNAPYVAPMKWLHGQVIDMIHVDLWSGRMPDWLPIWGGYDVCVLPIFNIADVAIFVGILIILCFYNEVADGEEKNKTVASFSNDPMV